MTHLRLLALWRGHAGSLAALIGIGVAVSATWAVQALVLSRVFAALLTGVPISDPAVLTLIGVLAAALVARPFLSLSRALVTQRAMTAVKTDLRARALGGLIERAATAPGDGRSGRDQAALVDGVENLDAYLSSYVPQLAVTGVVVTVVGAVLVSVDPVIGLVAIAATLLLPLAPRVWDRVLARRGNDHWDAYQNLHADVVDSLRGMTTLVAFGQEERRQRELATASDRLLRNTLAQLRVSLVESGLSQFALFAVPALVLVLIAARGPQLDAFAVFALVLLSLELVRPLRELASAWHAGYLGTFSGPGVLALVAASDGAAAAGSAAPRMRLPLVVTDLVVRHPGSEVAAVRGATFRLPAGVTAIVGATGAGKSSLAAALAGLLPPVSGTVAEGTRDLDAAELRARVSLVAQDPTLFRDTVREEILLGLGDRAETPDAEDLERVAEIAARAGIGRETGSLTLDTAVGDGGAALSGGQRQRVAIARGALQDRSVLVLDEATSALDPAAESAVIAALARDRPRDAIVAVTHRLAVAARADQVLVMVDGVVVEAGAPDELRARGGAYAALLQAEHAGRVIA